MIDRVLYYTAIGLLGILSALAIEVFAQYSIPVFAFAAYLLLINKYGFSGNASLAGGLTQIIILILLSPTNYIFSVLILFMLVLYLIGKRTKTLLWQVLFNIFFLASLALTPGYVLIFFVKYQRLILLIGELGV